MKKITDLKQLKEKYRYKTEDETCPICKSKYQDQTMLDKCFHSFCFTCIGSWAKISQLCPLCKSKYTSVIHNIVADSEFKRIPIEEFRKIDLKNFSNQKNMEKNPFMICNIEDYKRMLYNFYFDPVFEFVEKTSSFDIQQFPKLQKRIKDFVHFELKFVLESFGFNNEKEKNIQKQNQDSNFDIIMDYIISVIFEFGVDEEILKKKLTEFLFEKTNIFIKELMAFLHVNEELENYNRKLIEIIKEIILGKEEKEK
ncbi:topoisomerase i-binding arginine/serine-rich a-related [Anaeramoeba ignava]|uniref:RING-type E3 ubiquitin transferase n=1 Tax=Anaeramoeba ignava TaxID=1746090 RepID=A0A9Q0R420_ANAIG|nr:topoisomerase i-binding arginine/serine-rich a-related [Anaeramoeba ignava]